MKICWFDDYQLGLVRNDKIYNVTDVLKYLPPTRYPARNTGDLLIANLLLIHDEINKVAEKARSCSIKDARLLSPVVSPTKIIGTPVNYLKHVEETHADRATFTRRYQGSIEEQGLFLKATSSLVGCSEGVQIRFPERRTDHEMELGVVIGKAARNVSEEEALGFVAGYTIALDMVVRGPEDRSFRKSIDTYAVVGPWLVTADEVPNPNNLAFSLRVNGELRQSSNTAHMIMGIARQISWASQFYTLWPGDIIMTGTCEGVDRVRFGDVMHCEIEKIGAMDVQVRDA